MAVIKVNKNFIGLSTDTKPDLSAVKVLPFTFFNEVNTGKVFVAQDTITDGVTTIAWKEIAFSA